MRRVPLPEPVGAPASLWTEPDGGLRVGVPGRLLRLSALGVAEGEPLAVPRGAGAPTPVEGAATGDSLLLLRTAPGAVAAVHPRGGDDSAGTRDAGAPRAFAADPAGRWLYAGRPGGGVEGWSLPDLVPSWGWPELGRGPAALAVSPLGDRVYVGAAGEEGPAVRVLDAWSGRELARAELPHPALSLETDGAGRLLAVVAEEDGEARGAELLLLAHEGAGLRVVWAREADDLGLRGAPRARLGPAGRSAVAWGEGGVRLLDARTGELVGRSGEAPLDAAFDRAGRLLLLFPNEIRSVR